MAKSKSKSKSNFDFKQMLMQHGERIGLFAAAGLTLLMVLLSLFWPGSGIFSGSPTEKATALNQPAEHVERALKDPNNKPTDADKPPADSQNKLTKLSTKAVDGSEFRIAGLMSEVDSISTGRKQPKVEKITEGQAAVARVQVRTYLFAPGNPPKIYVLKAEGEEASAPPKAMKDKGMKDKAPKMPGADLAKRFGGGGKGGGPGGGYPGGMMGPGMMGPGMDKDKGKDKEKVLKGGKRKPPATLFELPKVAKGETRQGKRPVAISLDKLESTAEPPAVQVRPLRMAIIAAAFPYKAQVEEFQKRLGHRTTDEVLNEGVLRDDKKTALFAFRFLGVIVERRELDLDGNPIPYKDSEGKEVKDGWYEFDLNGSYKPYVVLTGKGFETDDSELTPISYPGLVMPRLTYVRTEETGGESGMEGPMSMPRGPMSTPKGPMSPRPDKGKGKDRDLGKDKEDKPAKKEAEENPYPDIEKKLPALKKTLKDLEDKDPTEVAAPPSRFKLDDDFDIFNPGKTAPAGKGKDGEMMPAPYIPGKTKGPMPGSEDSEIKPRELPDHCLVRLIDVTVQPGKTYEYRLKVRMGNPNMNRTDVASPSYRKEEYLEAKEWSKPIRVHVDHELNYYAVDQEPIERAKADKPEQFRYRGPYSGRIANDFRADRQMYFQAHRWLDKVTHRGNEKEVGEWTVAERFPVYRGEYIGRSERVKLPVWRFDLEDFVIAVDATTAKNNPGIAVHFGYKRGGEQPEAILVDFENGSVGYNKPPTGEKAKSVTIRDNTAGEALLLTPDGKLLLRETARDAADKKRQDLLDKIKSRVKDVESRGKDEEKEEKDKEKKGKFGQDNN